MLRFLIGLISLAGLALQAAPTHELTQEFQTTVAGQEISLPAGSPVEVAPGGGSPAMVRHTLPSGSVTLLLIPLTHLRPLSARPAATSSAAVPPSPSPATQPLPSPAVPTPPATRVFRLATKSGAVVEGDILRLEKRYVVVRTAGGSVEDVSLKSLDQDSLKEIERWKLRSGGKPAGPDPRLVPGEKVVLTFPDLGDSRSSSPTQITIRIPETFEPGRKLPLALFLAGGEGSHNCDALTGLVDPTQWILVAFPYPKELPRPRGTVEEKKSAEFIEKMKPLLERVEALVPDTDPQRRVVIGSSNGAHAMAIAACDGWKDFTDYFHAYVFHEGGASERGNFSELRRKPVLVVMGQNSESIGFAQWVQEAIEEARAKVDVFVAPGEGHPMGGNSREAIRKWVAELPQGGR